MRPQSSAPFGVCVALLVACSQLHSADLPITHVVLYKHGVGFFERTGTVAAGEEARLDFKNNDMNDVLKSLIVNEGSGKRIFGIRYDSNESLQQRLEKFPFAVGDGEPLSTFLDGLRGARIELKTAERSVSGTILSARAIQAGPDTDRKLIREQISLLLDSGEIATYDLGAVSSLQLLDTRLQNQLKQYLQTVNNVRSAEKRSVYIDAAASGKRDLRVAYITPAAIWKSSYRLSLSSGDSSLEGWAIVDNTTEEDWNNIQLSVVSGRPISFISQLDTPRYGQRQIAELPEDRAAGPVVYGGSVDSAPKLSRSDGTQLGTGSGMGYGVASGGAAGRVLSAPAPTVKQFVANNLMASRAPESSTVEGATGSQLGELFEYNFAEPVTVKRSQSAMLPFLHGHVAARKLLIYTATGSEHPVNAAEITNSTSKTLDGGPITVYDAGAYAGEALVETLKAGDKRLIGYAVDYGTRITTAYNSSDKTIREIHAQNGVLHLRYASRQIRTYTIKNVDPKPKTLIIQQEALNDVSLLSPKPLERTASAYRFEVAVPGNETQTLKVEGEHVYEDTTEVLSATPDFLVSITQNKEISDAGRKQLQAVLDLKRRQVQTDRELGTAESQLRELTNDQARLRQNIDSLNRVNGQEDQVRRYSSNLAANEAQIAKLRDQQRNLSQQKASLDADLRTAVAALEF